MRNGYGDPPQATERPFKDFLEKPVEGRESHLAAGLVIRNDVSPESPGATESTWLDGTEHKRKTEPRGDGSGVPVGPALPAALATSELWGTLKPMHSHFPIRRFQLDLCYF